MTGPVKLREKRFFDEGFIKGELCFLYESYVRLADITPERWLITLRSSMNAWALGHVEPLVCPPRHP